MSNPVKEMEFVKTVSEAAIKAPFALYAEAWGLNGGDKKGDDSNPFLRPLTAPMQAIMRDMQKELNDALKIDIYKI